MSIKTSITKVLTEKQNNNNEYNKYILDLTRKEKLKEKRDINKLPEIEKQELLFSQKEIRYRNIINNLLAENKNLEETIIKISKLKQKGKVLINLHTLWLLCKYMYEVEQQTDAYLIYDDENFVRLDNIYIRKGMKSQQEDKKNTGLFYVDD